MAPQGKYRERQDQRLYRDPRENDDGAEIIDLATRSVLPGVSQRKRSDSLGLGFGILIVAGLGAVTLWSMDSLRNTANDKKAADDFVVPAANPMADTISSEEMPIMPMPPSALSPEEMAFQEGIMPPIDYARAPEERPMPVAQPARAPVANTTLVIDNSLPVGSIGASPSSNPAERAGDGDKGDDFMARIGGMGGDAAVARASFDPTTTVTQGTLIPAVLETAINTDVPGYVRAVVSTNVRSFDGTKVLVPRSSRLIGQYKSGVAGAQKRAYVVWTRLIRPDGVSVNLGSPAVGFAGDTGLAGKVDSHFFERFGSAMLLSVVGGLSAISSGGASLVIGGGQSAAAAAVGQGNNITPTIRVKQGEPIRVFTARDLDFSKVS